MLGSMQKLHSCGFFCILGRPVFSQGPDVPAPLSGRSR